MDLSMGDQTIATKKQKPANGDVRWVCKCGFSTFQPPAVTEVMHRCKNNQDRKLKRDTAST